MQLSSLGSFEKWSSLRADSLKAKQMQMQRPVSYIACVYVQRAGYTLTTHVAEHAAPVPSACPQAVAGYNADPSVHGILVQLPLPPHIDEQRVLDAISIEKDVDGFHPLNIGRLAMRGRDPLFVPCTPKGCLELLKRSGVALSGKKAAVVGRSNIVGMPAALLLQREDCTVTVIHSRTANAQRICAEADIVIAACGKAEMVGGDWIKEGAVVIDVGINAVDVSRSCRVGLGWAGAGWRCWAVLFCRLERVESRKQRQTSTMLWKRTLPHFPAASLLPCRTPLPSAATGWLAT